MLVAPDALASIGQKRKRLQFGMAAWAPVSVATDLA